MSTVWIPLCAICEPKEVEVYCKNYKIVHSYYNELIHKSDNKPYNKEPISSFNNLENEQAMMWSSLA